MSKIMSNSNKDVHVLEDVERNSALKFIAPAQASSSKAAINNGNEQSQTERTMPAGLKALCEACSRLYPDQPNPLQVTTRLKYWLGGLDPLDYISMYWNPGKPEEHVPPHWHYISFGLSDLHGDGRVHPPPDRVLLSSPNHPPSGYGLEMTFRLSAEPGGAPPLWPAALLQALARYVFTTGNKFCSGDHITWHAPLDGCGTKSRVRHLLVADDAQLPTVDTQHGTVTFLQLVGCTGKELRAAQRSSGFEVLKLIGKDTCCGGSWLVTKVRRVRSARGVARGLCSGPAHLAGVSARVRWQPWQGDPKKSDENLCLSSELPPNVEQEIKDTLQRGLTNMSTDRTGPEGHMSTDSFEMSSIERALPQISESMQGSWRNDDVVEYLEGVHVTLNPEGASLLPLAINGRVLHDRHFTWREGGRAVTVLSPLVAGSFVTSARPYAIKGAWLQILIPNDLAKEVSKQVSNLEKLANTDSESDSGDDSNEKNNETVTIPITLTWPKYKLKITVIHDHEIL